MDLKINYELLDGVSAQVIAKGEEFSSLLSKIRGINEELKSYWEGSDASKYSTAVEAQSQNMQKLGEAINEIGAFLQKVSKAYQDACQANADAIKN